MKKKKPLINVGTAHQHQHTGFTEAHKTTDRKEKTDKGSPRLLSAAMIIFSGVVRNRFVHNYAMMHF